MNQAAFRWGRRAAIDLQEVERLARPEAVQDDRRLSQSLPEMIERRVAFLTQYQNRAYAQRYRTLVERTQAAEAEKTPGKSGLAEAVARYLFKLRAYKDEYEVARLYTDGAFLRQVANEVDGENLRLEFHLAPPLLARRDPETGKPKKMAFGPWLLSAFGLLAKLKFLRGTPFDPFGRTIERRTERALVRRYETMLDELLARLSPQNHHIAVALASIPEKIRGFGHVKAWHLQSAKAEEAALIEQFRAGPAPALKAAE